MGWVRWRLCVGKGGSNGARATGASCGVWFAWRVDASRAEGAKWANRGGTNLDRACCTWPGGGGSGTHGVRCLKNIFSRLFLYVWHDKRRARAWRGGGVCLTAVGARVGRNGRARVQRAGREPPVTTRHSLIEENFCDSGAGGRTRMRAFERHPPPPTARAALDRSGMRRSRKNVLFHAVVWCAAAAHLLVLATRRVRIPR